MVYYIKEAKIESRNAGGKAPADIERTCKDLGYVEICFPHRVAGNESTYKKIRLFILSTIGWVKVLKTLTSEDCLIFQHPMAAMPLMPIAIKLLKQKRVTTIAVIHDMNSLRGGMKGAELARYKRYDKALKNASQVIAHNESMMKAIEREYDIKIDEMIPLGIFDYYTSTEDDSNIEVTPFSIAIAGNLSETKSNYIYEFCKNNRDIEAQLFGIGIDHRTITANAKYHGSFDADILPNEICKSKASFGIVWDGPTYCTCEGIARYLKINNPHKTSLYLASGIPVICWDKSAIATFVRQNGVGIAVNSLENMHETLNKISKDDYDTMRKNAKDIGKKIRNGYYSKKALTQAVSKNDIKVAEASNEK